METKLTEEQMEIAKDYIQNFLSYMQGYGDESTPSEFIQNIADYVKEHIDHAEWEDVYKQAKAEINEKKVKEEEERKERNRKWNAMTDEEQDLAMPF